MAEPSLTSVLECLHRVVGPAANGEVTDAELLERFVRSRDQAAFELLVWRHGPMVLALCRRLLRHEQDAEDALQATFLVLVRKAGSISKRQSLASWLYKVAYRIASRARLRPAPLTNHASMPEIETAEHGETESIWRELRERLDGEIARLPERYRRPLILCYLEGKTHDEAARLLGCPKGTLASQVARARDRLHRRLTRRGWEFPSGVLAALLAERASAVPMAAELVHVTVRSALAYASGQTLAVASAKAAAMAEGALRLMWYGKLKIVGGVLLAVAVSATGIGLVARDLWAAGGAEEAQAAPMQPPAPQQARAGPEADSKKEIAVLRAEIADLRDELAAALKEIKGLKETLRQAGGRKEQEPMFRGKPAAFWVEQLRDADDGFRLAAVQALAALALKDHDLTPALIGALSDPSTQVHIAAQYALTKLVPGPVGMGARLRHTLRDDPSPHARAGAAHVLRHIRGKETVAALTAALNDRDAAVVNAAADGLATLGASAKSAIADLVDAFDKALRDARLNPATKTVPFENLRVNPSFILSAILSIEPEEANSAEVAKVRAAYPKNPLAMPQLGIKSDWRSSIYEEELPLWRKLAEALKKKYVRP